MANSKAFCWACLAVYTTIMLTITTVYLWMQLGRQRGFAEVREEMQHRHDGSANINGIAFAESGWAEYILVALFHASHLICLALFLFGHQSRMKMVVGCALLLSCALVYIIFYGCVILQGRLEQLHQQRFLASSEAVAALQPKQGGSLPHEIEIHFADRATAGAVAAASPYNGEQDKVSRVSVEGVRGGLGKCGAASVDASDSLSYGSVVWSAFETLIDVLATIVSSSDGPAGSGEVDLHPDGALISSKVPFSGLFRLSLFVLNCAGFVLSICGVVLFDISSASESAPISSAGPAASALSQLAAGRRGRAAAALSDSAAPASPPTVTAAEAKKTQ
ncbi:hypothetical protein GH5_04302 [Leishmania sp. Ghana 2012 LV757]|uniref:hypothetical protein n=1 Tax=Leishmania sp. Ghana 2012 LV757 TaxID=2803181 RepID=UPI001B5DD1A8|nr:hypothetical protein GH5_04302 [Leishmania sp. Ghana 2012 LV757]